MKTRVIHLLALTAAAVVWHEARAADTPAAPPAAKAAAAAPADKLAEARKQIAAKQWPAAIDALKRVNDTGSAEWNNLMGYSLRKGKTPDLAASEKYYDEALRIDPHHRDTLEYSGELYLMKGELDKAQARLATLATECASKCEQYTDLKTAIERYQAAGNKFVATNW
jgi:tetratricopeptide (TPR) repeat protein